MPPGLSSDASPIPGPVETRRGRANRYGFFQWGRRLAQLEQRMLASDLAFGALMEPRNCTGANTFSAFGKLFVLTACSLSAWGCIRTNVSTDLNSRVTVREYNQMMVWARSVEARVQGSLEAEFLTLATEKGLNTNILMAWQHLDVHQEYSMEDLAAKLQNLDAGAALFLFPTDAGVSVTGIPHTQALQYEIPAHTAEAPWEHLSAMLFDAELGETVWLADVELTGTSFQVRSDLRSRFLEEVLEELQTAGFVGR